MSSKNASKSRSGAYDPVTTPPNKRVIEENAIEGNENDVPN
jgi:hypothetical protein